MKVDSKNILVTQLSSAPSQPLLVTSPFLRKRSQLFLGLETGCLPTLWSCLWFLLLLAAWPLLGLNCLAKLFLGGRARLLEGWKDLALPPWPGGGR